MVTAIYNEIDGYAARWLRNLVDAGAIAPGAVETRSIRDLRPEDVRDAIQFHTFAGIGGWSHALRLAGWPDGTPVWTGSCPCQPFSRAGKGAGFADDRHLWPAWFELIRECRPGVVLGEQVAGPAGLAWLDVVFADLEREGYAVGAADLAAASVAAPHLRQRIYFVGVLDRGMADAFVGNRTLRDATEVGGSHDVVAGSPDPHAHAHRGEDVGLVDANGDGRSRDAGTVSREETEGWDPRAPVGPGAPSGRVDPWVACDWLLYLDGKLRPSQPGSRPLADGVPGSMERLGARERQQQLRGYGNAIVPQVAAEWIGAVMDTIGIRRTA